MTHEQWRGVWGLARGAIWVVLLWGVDRPWHELGGVVHERLRWLETLVLFMAVLAGHTAGSMLGALRLALYPVLGVAAAATIGLQLSGEPELLLIVFTGLLSYAAGLDAGLTGLRVLGSRRSDDGATRRVDSG